MSQPFLILGSIIAGVVLGAISNWIYDLLRQRSILPDRPTLKRALIVILAFLPLVMFVALPDLVTPESSALTAEQLKGKGAYIEIERVSPAPDSATFIADVETPVVVNVKYYLPANALSPQVQLQYLTSFQEQPRNVNYHVIQTLPAEVGLHYVQLAGTVKPPNLSALNGQPFEIRVDIEVLNREKGHSETVAFKNVVFNLQSGQ